MELILSFVIRQWRKFFSKVRTERRPFVVHAKVPLLGHHTSGVRKEWYRDDLEEAATRDPYPKLMQNLNDFGIANEDLAKIEKVIALEVDDAYDRALNAEDPTPESVTDHHFAPTPITGKGEREPKGKKENRDG